MVILRMMVVVWLLMLVMGGELMMRWLVLWLFFVGLK